MKAILPIIILCVIAVAVAVFYFKSETPKETPAPQVSGAMTMPIQSPSPSNLETKKIFQTRCPVMDREINRDSLYVDFNNQRIFVCCKPCVEKVKADPQKYIDIIESRGETVWKLQTICPVMGGEVNKELFVDVKGKRIYICCQACEEDLKKNPDKYIEKLENQGVIIEDAPAK